MKYDIKEVHKSEIVAGDVILWHDGSLKTVCRENITHDSFMGLCLFGDSFMLGYQKVKKVINLKN